MGTALERSKVPLQKWAIAIFLELTSLKGVSSMKLHRDLQVTQRTAWFMLHPHPGGLGAGLRRGCSRVRPKRDESYFGGKVKNWPLSRRKAKGKRGTGTIGKTPVAAVLDRPTKRIRAKVLPNTQIPTVQQFVRSGLTPGATLYTDEATAYSRMPEYAHEAVRHSVFEYVGGQAHSNGLESFWSMLKRAYHGTYHHLSAKHLQRYVDEYATRHGYGTPTRWRKWRRPLGASSGGGITYKDLTS